MLVCSFFLFEFILDLFLWPLKVVIKAGQKTKAKGIVTYCNENDCPFEDKRHKRL